MNERGIESGKIHALPIVAIGQGRVLGDVADVIVDPDTQALLGVTISGGKSHDGEFIDAGRIRRLGPFAVIVMHAEDAQPLDTHERATYVTSARVAVYGARVLTETGQPVGKIDRIRFEDDGRVRSYRTSTGGFMGRTREMTPKDVSVVGEDVVIVDSRVLGPKRTLTGMSSAPAPTPSTAADGAQPAGGGTSSTTTD